ncbi:hypothetical protein J4230_01055 [Candidatus Woesearchaeota archaeon]|nr:hypothetical protein [Candidatus Woesearchaeota archaeon]
MATESRIETPEPIPRIYGLATRTSSNVHIVYPISAFLTATVQLATQEELSRDVAQWQKYRKWLRERTEKCEHTRPDSPVFKLGKKASKLVDADPAEAKEAILEAIVRDEDAMNLWVKDRYEEALESPKPYYKIMNLTSGVASKSNSRGRSAHRLVSIANPNLTRGGSLGIQELNCGCEDSFYNGLRSKQNAVFCHHSAALLLAYHATVTGRDKLVKLAFTKEIPDDPALPFDITPYNTRSTAYLNIDFLVARYVERTSLFEINRKLARLGHLLFTPAVNTMLRDGRMWFEVVRNGLKKVKESPRYMADTFGLLTRVKETLRAEGYRGVGYCIEYEGTPYEAITQRWTSEDKKEGISLVYTESLPLHYVRRRFIDGETDNYGDAKFRLTSEKKELLSSHPYSRIGKEYEDIDDMTRRRSRTKVILPGNPKARNSIAVPTSVTKRQREVFDSLVK